MGDLGAIPSACQKPCAREKWFESFQSRTATRVGKVGTRTGGPQHLLALCADKKVEHHIHGGTFATTRVLRHRSNSQGAPHKRMLPRRSGDTCCVHRACTDSETRRISLGGYDSRDPVNIEMDAFFTGCFEIRKFRNRGDHCGGPLHELYQRYSRSKLIERRKRSHQLGIPCRRFSLGNRCPEYNRRKFVAMLIAAFRSWCKMTSHSTVGERRRPLIS